MLESSKSMSQCESEIQACKSSINLDSESQQGNEFTGQTSAGGDK